MQYQIKENCLTIFLPAEVDHHNAEEIKREADKVIEEQHIKYVIFDFGRTNFMDSSGDWSDHGTVPAYLSSWRGSMGDTYK